MRWNGEIQLTDQSCLSVVVLLVAILILRQIKGRLLSLLVIALMVSCLLRFIIIMPIIYKRQKRE